MRARYAGRPPPPETDSGAREQECGCCRGVKVKNSERARDDMAQTRNDQQRVRQLIAEIEAACGDGEAVFRGEPGKYKDPVSSGIYREHKEIFNEHYQPIDVEKKIVRKARAALFSEGTPIVDILTDLRHFGGDTALVDFSRDLLVALFFACNGDTEKDGYVFVLPTAELGKIGSNEIHSDARGLDVALVSAARTPHSRARVDAQGSVFVHVPGKKVEGFETIEIPGDMKSACLAHLARFHDIRQETMYNDLIGHIQNERNFRTAKTDFYGGLAKQALGDHTGAIKDYDEAIRLRPQFPEAFNNRGIAKFALGKHAEAIKDYDAAIRLRPQDPEAFNNRGNAKLALDDHAGAIEDHDEAIRLRSDYPEAFNNRGNAKHALGDHAGAIGDYNEAIRLRSDYPEAFNNRGNAKLALGDHTGAIKDYDAAIRLRPEYPEAFYNRGTAKRYLGDHTGAIGDYDAAIRLRPEYPEAFNNRGIAKCAFDDHAGAIKDYDAAIRLRPEFPEMFNNRGNAKLALGDHTEAIKDYDEAIRLRPDYLEAFINRGNAKRALDDHTGAIKDYDAAIRLRPEYSEAFHNRGIAMLDFVNMEDARTDLETALALAHEQGNGRVAAAAADALAKLAGER